VASVRPGEHTNSSVALPRHRMESSSSTNAGTGTERATISTNLSNGIVRQCITVLLPVSLSAQTRQMLTSTPPDGD
jgi:hypothetical protein